MSTNAGNSRSGLTRRAVLPLLAAGLSIPQLGWAAAETTPTLIDALYNLPWIPDGTPWQRHAYVIAAPWCPWCKDLYRETRETVSKVQLRWIEAGGDRGDKWAAYDFALARSRDPRMLAEIYETNAITEPTPLNYNAVDLVDGALHAWEDEFNRLLGRNYAFPTILYRNGDRTEVMPHDDPDVLIARLLDIAPDNRQPLNLSDGSDLLSRAFKVEALGENMAAIGKGDVPMRALPFADAPLAGTLRDDGAAPAVARVRNEAGNWIAVTRAPSNGGARRFSRTYLPADRVELQPLA
jgi:hypothetical protein